MLNVIASEDAKDSTSAPVRVADFTSKIGQDIKGMKIAFRRNTSVKGLTQKSKKRFLMQLSTLRNWEQLSKKSACLILNTGLPYTTSSLHLKLLQTCNVFDGIRYGFRAEDAKNLDDIYVNTRSQGFGDEVKRRIMLGTFSLSSGYYDAYYKKAGQVRTLIIQDFEKVFADYDSSLVQQLQV